MNIERDVTFHGIKHDSTIDALLDERIKLLPHFYDQATRVRVVVDVPHRSHPGHNPYTVKLEINVKHGAPIVVESDPAHDVDEPLDITARDVFSVAERQLRKLHDRRAHEHRA